MACSLISYSQENEPDVTIEIIKKVIPSTSNSTDGQLHLKVHSNSLDVSTAILIEGKNPQLFQSDTILLENLSSEIVTIVVHGNSGDDYIEKIIMTSNE